MTAKILSVTCLQSACTVTVALMGGEGEREKLRFTLFPADYTALGTPEKGMSLEEEMLDMLANAHARHEACRRALMILEAGDNSENSLYRKLRQRNSSDEAARFAVSYVRNGGWLDEDRQLRRLTLRLAEEKLWGAPRLVAHLANKGYRAAHVREIIDELQETGELDFSEIKRTLFKKEAPKTRADWQKCLYKHGFSSASDL